MLLKLETVKSAWAWAKVIFSCDLSGGGATKLRPIQTLAKTAMVARKTNPDNQDQSLPAWSCFTCALSLRASSMDASADLNHKPRLAIVIDGTRLQFVPKGSNDLVNTTTQGNNPWNVQNERPLQVFWDIVGG